MTSIKALQDKIKEKPLFLLPFKNCSLSTPKSKFYALLISSISWISMSKSPINNNFSCNTQSLMYVINIHSDILCQRLTFIKQKIKLLYNCKILVSVNWTIHLIILEVTIHNQNSSLKPVGFMETTKAKLY